MRRVYYHVPACPECGSFRTGRYVSRLFSNEDTMKEEALKHGEYIRTQSIDEDGSAFCLDCGYEWDADIAPKLMTEGEIEKEKTVRGTREEYAKLVNEKKTRKTWLERLLRG